MYDYVYSVFMYDGWRGRKQIIRIFFYFVEAKRKENKGYKMFISVHILTWGRRRNPLGNLRSRFIYSGISSKRKNLKDDKSHDMWTFCRGANRAKLAPPADAN